MQAIRPCQSWLCLALFIGFGGPYHRFRIEARKILPLNLEIIAQILIAGMTPPQNNALVPMQTSAASNYAEANYENILARHHDCSSHSKPRRG